MRVATWVVVPGAQPAPGGAAPMVSAPPGLSPAPAAAAMQVVEPAVDVAMPVAGVQVRQRASAAGCIRKCGFVGCDGSHRLSWHAANECAPSPLPPRYMGLAAFFGPAVFSSRVNCSSAAACIRAPTPIRQLPTCLPRSLAAPRRSCSPWPRSCPSSPRSRCS